MSIYSRRYTRYEGPLEPVKTRFWVIAETELRRLLKEKWVRRLFLLAWAPVLVLGAQLYMTRFQLDSDTSQVFVNLFRSESVAVAVMLAAFGASMIARDINNRALTIFFTRPVTVDQYLWGKLLGAILCVLGVTLVPGILLAAARSLLIDGITAADTFNDLWRVAVASAIGATLVSTLILLLSSLIRSPRFVGFTWLGLFIFLEIAREVLNQVIPNQALFQLISVRRLFEGTAEYLFTADSEHLPALVGAIGFSLFFYVALRLRIGALERAHT